MVSYSIVHRSISILPSCEHFFTDKDIKPLEGIMSTLHCSVLGLNRHFPIVLLHGSMLLGGMGIHIQHSSTVTQKFKASIIFTHLEVGTFQQFFFLPYTRYRLLVTHTMRVQIWKETTDYGMHLHPSSTASWTPNPLSHNGIPLMEFTTQRYGTNVCLVSRIF